MTGFQIKVLCVWAIPMILVFSVVIASMVSRRASQFFDISEWSWAGIVCVLAVIPVINLYATFALIGMVFENIKLPKPRGWK